MRLDKLIGSVTDLSRAMAKRAIREGAVTVDGAVVRDPAADVGAETAVTLDGRPLRAVGPRYFMLHKPAGVVCAARDRLHQTVLDLLPDEDNVETLHVAGRLDIDTTGLVLLTDDGQWSHRVTSPRHRTEKHYLVTTAEPIDASVAGQFERGLFLHNEKRRLLPARLEQLAPCRARVIIAEGKYHQVKRMFAAVGNAVLELHRERIGAVALDPTLPEGGYRPLTAMEVSALASAPESAAEEA
ncbi:MAG: 16S rRNA pseudouridine(516) synthase RsuA [Spongiibacteraceae bacterium]|jgi:16S rRNA pseudouridine516 synthase|nr:16S rRNA pseudouridine(516) synthase RsuA [Spongiibacteraceae bacterium]